MFDQFSERTYFSNARDHRNDDVDLLLERRTKQCPNLCTQKLSVAKSQPNGPKAERRIFLSCLVLIQKLIGAYVEGPNFNSAIAGRFGDLAIGLVLFVLRRKSAITIKEELRPIEPDPLCPKLLCLTETGGCVGICVKTDLGSIQCLERNIGGGFARVESVVEVSGGG